MTITELLTALGTAFTTIIGTFDGVLDLFTTNPILLLGIAMAFSGTIIAKVRKLIGR